VRHSISDNRASLGVIAAAEVSATITLLLTTRSHLRLIFACAPSQDQFLAELRRTAIPWDRISIFHMDEYLGISQTHPASFRKYLRDHLLNYIEPCAFHAIDGEAQDAEAECDRYSALLREAPIDLVCLGIGENGHLAFNDPPVAEFNDSRIAKVVELDPLCRQQQVNDGCFSTLADVPRHAITLTIPTLMSASAIFSIVPGQRKAAAVHNATHPNVKLYLDIDSAALLPG
jgi:glucosamine-6-phosphate deaminase